jgi:hypothetical protein
MAADALADLVSVMERYPEARATLNAELGEEETPRGGRGARTRCHAPQYYA